MRTTVALLVETGKPLEVAELELPPPGPGQVLVEVAYSGVCHTQLLETQGQRGHDPFLPHALGHEGSGTVVSTGPGVTKVRPGDRVVLSWMKGSGQDTGGSRWPWRDAIANAGPITTFSRHTIVSENRVTALASSLELRAAALLGCAVPTGFGSVLHTGRAQLGESAVVLGVGGIGLCAVAAAKAAGCDPVLAVDVVPERLELALRQGATHAVNASAENPVEAAKAVCPGGVDLAVEASGRPTATEQALAMVRPRGGRAVIVGNARHGERLALDPRELNQGKSLLGTWGGDNVPDRDFPRYARLLEAGRLRLGPFVQATYRLEDANAALEEMQRGKVLRPLLDMALR